LQVTPQQVNFRTLSDKNPIAINGEIMVEKQLSSGSLLRLGETELRVSFDTSLANDRSHLQVVPVIDEHHPLVPSLGKSPQGGAAALAESSKGLSPQAKSSSPAPAARWAAQSPTQNVWPSVETSGRQALAPSLSMPDLSGGSGKNRFYMILGAVVIGAAYFFTQDQIKKRHEVKLRDTVQTETSIAESQTETEKVLKSIEDRGEDTIQYRTAQEQYLRGFRDYLQGQYVRATEEFQAALSFYPNHELARKYLSLSKRKFDEQVQYNMIKGKRYYGVANYRLCMGFYSTVIKMKKDERDPVRREALQYYHECEVKMRGKY